MSWFEKDGNVFQTSSKIQDDAFIASGYKKIEKGEGAKKASSSTPSAKASEPVKEVEEVKSESISLTRTDVMRMNIADLQRLAIEKGIADASEKSGAELKKALIEVLGV